MAITGDRYVGKYEGHGIELVRNNWDKTLKLLIDGKEVASESRVPHTLATLHADSALKAYASCALCRLRLARAAERGSDTLQDGSRTILGEVSGPLRGSPVYPLVSAHARVDSQTTGKPYSYTASLP